MEPKTLLSETVLFFAFAEYVSPALMVISLLRVVDMVSSVVNPNILIHQQKPLQHLKPLIEKNLKTLLWKVPM